MLHQVLIDRYLADQEIEVVVVNWDKDDRLDIHDGKE